jgi:hypothetical protein
MKHGTVFWHPAIAEHGTSSNDSPLARWTRIQWRRPRLSDGLVVSFTVFIVAMAACVIIEPEAARDNNGVRYFDHVTYALIPYVIGVISIAAMAVLVARDLPTRVEPWRTLRLALFAIAALLVGIVLTPDYVNEFFNWAHVAVSVALFGSQFALVAWLALWVWRTPLNVAALVLLTAIGLVAGASQLNLLAVLFVSEIAFQFVFLFVLARVAARFDLTRPPRRATAAKPRRRRVRLRRPRQGSNLRPPA